MTSDGEAYGTQWRARDALNEKEIRKAQRKVARRPKGKNGRRKARRELQAVFQKSNNRRRHLAEKTSAELVRHHDAIAVEDLNVKELAQLDSPDKSPAQNRRLRKSGADRALGMLRDKIEWKCEREGRLFAAVDPKGTSQECSRCGATVKKGLHVRTHNCPNCGRSLDRDVNAAINILRRANFERPVG